MTTIECPNCGGEGIVNGLVVGDSVRLERCRECNGKGKVPRSKDDVLFEVVVDQIDQALADSLGNPNPRMIAVRLERAGLLRKAS